MDSVNMEDTRIGHNIFKQKILFESKWLKFQVVVDGVRKFAIIVKFNAKLWYDL